MKKFLFFSGIVLASFLLASCKDSYSEKSETTIEIRNSSHDKKQSIPSKIGDSYIFTENDITARSHGGVGLKATINSAEIKEIKNVNQEVVKAVVFQWTAENTTDHYIDLVGFTIIDGAGNPARSTFSEGISTFPVDGIGPGMKVNITEVYQVENDSKPYTIMYEDHSWTVE